MSTPGEQETLISLYEKLVIETTVSEDMIKGWLDDLVRNIENDEYVKLCVFLSAKELIEKKDKRAVPPFRYFLFAHYENDEIKPAEHLNIKILPDCFKLPIPFHYIKKEDLKVEILSNLKFSDGCLKGSQLRFWKSAEGKINISISCQKNESI